MKILETDRLILRTWRDSDLDALAAIDQDPEVCRYFPAIGNRATTAENIQCFKKYYEDHGFTFYAVELKSTHELIGSVGLKIPFFKADFIANAVEIDWTISSHHWGKGYTTEAAKAVLRYAFLVLDLNEVISYTAAINQASRRVMEKIGLQRDFYNDFDHPLLSDESVLKKHVLYRLSKQDYLQLVSFRSSIN